MSFCIYASIYEQSTIMMQKCGVSQREDRIDFYVDIPNNAFSQSDLNNHLFLNINEFYGRQETDRGCLLILLCVVST